jgi:hypothetical protein
LEQELGEPYSYTEGQHNGEPLIIDTERKKILLNPQSSRWPRAQNKRDFAQLAITAYELSLLEPEEDQKARFYQLLFDLLNL